jgi:Rap1a immunity proteins
MRKHLRFAAAFLMLFTSAANGEMSGSDLKQYCASYPRHNEATTMCMGYIGGTLDTVRGFARMLKAQWACEPAGVSGEQLVAMAIKYLSDHPEQLHGIAASLILNMYIRTFPCPDKAPLEAGP